MQLHLKKLFYVYVLAKYLQWFYSDDAVRRKAAYNLTLKALILSCFDLLLNFSEAAVDQNS